MVKKILHIADCDKFIPPYIQFINDNFNSKEHEFLLKSGMADDKLDSSSNVNLARQSIFSRLKHYLNFFIKMHSADKVILHSLLDIKVVQILFFSPWLLKKCYWMIWGADLYTYQRGNKTWKWKIKELLRRRVISKLGHLVTYLEGDVALAREWYGAKGKYHECLMYTSNLYKEHTMSGNDKMSVNIQVGNSADPSNNHIEVLEKLLIFKDENILIHVPLSYGPRDYSQQVINQGKEWFGDKFKPLIEFMPFNEYLFFLSKIDIAIFNHKRQQAMGNTITLLGLGKTVYINSNTTQWQFFEEQKINIGNVEKITTLEYQIKKENVEIVKKYFSIENYKYQLSQLFEI